MPLSVRKLKRRRKFAQSAKTSATSSSENDTDGFAFLVDSSASSENAFSFSKASRQAKHTIILQSDPANVAFWGYVLLLSSWLVFVGGLGGVLGIWDSIFGLKRGQAADLACFLCLLSVTGFVWVLLNWLGLKSFRMTSSKV